MKFTSALTLFLLMHVSCFAQVASNHDCYQWIMTKLDSASGKNVVTARDVIMISDDHEKTGLSIYSFLNSSGKVLVIYIQAVGAGTCVDKGDKINILFNDGEEIELSNTNDFNCDGAATMYFGGALGKEDALQMLTSRDIKTMRVWTRDDYMQRTFSEQDALNFKNTIHCLTSRLKE